MSGAPWMKFFPTDWLADTTLRVCGPAARGLWMDCLCLMHGAEPYGHLLINGRPVTDTQLATLTGIDPSTVRSLLTELETAGVFSRNRAGVIYSRRMTRDFKKANIAARNGQKGGNPNIDPGTIPKAERTKWRRSAHSKKVEQVWEQCRGHCIHCGVAMTRHDPNLPTAFEVDHKIPLRHGGTNEIGNLVGSCKHCNFQRTSNPGSNPEPNGTSNTQKPEAKKESPPNPPAGGKGGGDFFHFWTAYPSRGGAPNSEKPARELFAALVASGVDPAVIIGGARGYAAWAQKAGKDGTDKVMQASRFLHDQVYAEYSKPRAVPDSGIDPRWRNRIAHFRATGEWDHGWGPRPGAENCEAPADLVAEFRKEGAA